MSNRIRSSEKGFGMVGVLLAVILAIVIVGTGIYLYHKHSVDNKKVSSTALSATKNATSTNQKGANSTASDSYAGWKTYCDSTVAACIKYPSDWVAAQYGGLQNTACTEYAWLAAPTNKDESSDTAYIVSVSNFSTAISDLKIIGMVVNNKPSYGVYDTSYLSANNIQAGTTQAIDDGNYSFTDPSGDGSLVGTPCASGYAAITTLDQAKAWFTTTEGKTVLEVLQSFYYQ